MMQEQLTKEKIIKFFFPFWPMKIFQSVIGICTLAALIGLSIILNLFKIKITANITISMAWLPTIIIGWYFGPIIGLFMGFIIDTINWLIFSGVWFWLYAIQEPLLGLMVGLIASVFFLIKQSKNHFLWSLILNQILLFSFLIASIFIIFFYTDPNNSYFISASGVGGSNSEILIHTQLVLRWVILGILIALFIAIESLVGYKYHKWKINPELNQTMFETFLFMTIIAILSTVIFSFLLGPISAIKYYEFVNGVTAPNLVKYGVIFYLLPRVIKEAFKTPLYIVVLSLIVCALNPTIIRLKDKFHHSYH